MTRAIAAFLVVLLSSAIAAPLTCTGWEGSSADRRDCCKRAGHEDCQDQRAADSCCAAHEGTRQIAPALSLPALQAPTMVTAALSFAALDPAGPDRTVMRLFDVVLASRLHAPSPPLISPLRI